MCFAAVLLYLAIELHDVNSGRHIAMCCSKVDGVYLEREMHLVCACCNFHGENGAGNPEACRVGSVFLGFFHVKRMLSIFGRCELPTMCFFLFREGHLKRT
jgi:hypothetical protein